MPNALDISLHASAAETASGVGTSVDISDRSVAYLTLDNTVLSSGATLAVTIEHSLTGVDWKFVGKFTPLTAAAATTLTLPNTLRYLRARWALTGTSPSAMFSVTGQAHQIYCSPEDLVRYGLPESALKDFKIEDRVNACLSASDDASSYFASAFTMPLVKWGVATRKHVAKMAAYDLMSVKGFDPSGKDQLIKDGRDNAFKWLTQVSNGLRPPEILDTTPSDVEVDVYVDSVPSRGWRRW